MEVKIKSQYGELNYELTSQAYLDLLQTASLLSEGNKVATEERKPQPQKPVATYNKQSKPVMNPHYARFDDAKPRGYKGFLAIKCEHCGNLKPFCAKNALNISYCRECGAGTELVNLRKIDMFCKCGGHYHYQTNAEDAVITLECLNCGTPVDLEWNSHKSFYQSM